ncbi:Na+/H+ antiporter NhaC [Ornithinibacillus sp. L9]|uniref:Na+/H+ antiporter NhaC n=1 Tax=Ornithinibacillus caprae TaxID=2678566 RepID=A0A6N8FPH5_9BACI|nr:Na+/H+ antiporter NhaC [Ornithinibacillus caprae]MUK90554.1 Na+/H+ antiporter NhaC [Ornithinibacillus caprae]
MKKEMTIGLSIIPILALMVAAAFSILVWEAGMHFPLMIGIIAAASIAMICGSTWNDVQQMMVKGVSMALPAIFILLIIGTIVGSWIASGVIPTIIFYGLSIIKPEIFIPIVALVTGIVAVTLGSSFTAIATVGLAFMAIGQGLGFPPGLIAGAVISGAFFGDKLSPLSDTTNIAPVMAETDLFSHIKHMLWDTLPAFLLSILLFWIVSNTGAISGTADANTINELQEGLAAIFTIHPHLLLVPIITILLMMFRTPAVPALMGVALLGAVLAVVIQGGSISSIVQVMTNGYVSESGVATLDSLLNRGGLTSMLGTVALVILATSLGGVLEKSGAFEVLTRKIMTKVKTTGSLISSSILSTFVVSFASGAQYLAIILPARTFVTKYKEMGIDTKNLSRAVESAGTVGINLVPWGVPAVFIAGIFGLSPGEFIPYAFFVFLVPLVNILFGFTGWTIAKKDYSNELTTTEKEEQIV